jgi:hypothetical protein
MQVTKVIAPQSCPGVPRFCTKLAEFTTIDIVQHIYGYITLRTKEFQATVQTAAHDILLSTISSLRRIQYILGTFSPELRRHSHNHPIFHLSFLGMAILANANGLNYAYSLVTGKAPRIIVLRVIYPQALTTSHVYHI